MWVGGLGNVNCYLGVNFEPSCSLDVENLINRDTDVGNWKNVFRTKENRRPLEKNR